MDVCEYLNSLIAAKRSYSYDTKTAIFITKLEWPVTKPAGPTSYLFFFLNTSNDSVNVPNICRICKFAPALSFKSGIHAIERILLKTRFEAGKSLTECVTVVTITISLINKIRTIIPNPFHCVLTCFIWFPLGDDAQDLCLRLCTRYRSTSPNQCVIC